MTRRGQITPGAPPSFSREVRERAEGAKGAWHARDLDTACAEAQALADCIEAEGGEEMLLVVT